MAQPTPETEYKPRERKQSRSLPTHGRRHSHRPRWLDSPTLSLLPAARLSLPPLLPLLVLPLPLTLPLPLSPSPRSSSPLLPLPTPVSEDPTTGTLRLRVKLNGTEHLLASGFPSDQAQSMSDIGAQWLLESECRKVAQPTPETEYKPSRKPREYRPREYNKRVKLPSIPEPELHLVRAPGTFYHHDPSVRPAVAVASTVPIGAHAHPAAPPMRGERHGRLLFG